MSAPAYAIRRGGSSELQAAIAIDAATEGLYRAHGVVVSFADNHPFVVAERTRWTAAAASGHLYCAISDEQPIGFYVLGEVDGAPYLDQLSVHPDHGRRGVGRALLEHACTAVARAGGTQLTLTTYAHLPWNAPFYERCGFAPLPDSTLGPALRSLILAQRAVLPAPEHRIAMRRLLVSR